MNRIPAIARPCAALFATLLLALSLCATAFAKAPAAEVRKIEALIAAVETRPDAVFIRNGTEHTAAEAADHLRLKWRHAGKRIGTARDFVRHLATKSSFTGRKYRIRFADGREVDSAEFFLAELAKLEAAVAK